MCVIYAVALGPVLMQHAITTSKTFWIDTKMKDHKRPLRKQCFLPS